MGNEEWKISTTKHHLKLVVIYDHLSPWSNWRRHWLCLPDRPYIYRWLRHGCYPGSSPQSRGRVNMRKSRNVILHVYLETDVWISCACVHKSARGPCNHSRMTGTNLSHLLLALGLGGLGVGIVVSLDEHQVVGLGMDDKLAWRVLQREGHLVENSTQLLQGQNPASEKRVWVIMWDRNNDVFSWKYSSTNLLVEGHHLDSTKNKKKKQSPTNFWLKV